MTVAATAIRASFVMGVLGLVAVAVSFFSPEPLNAAAVQGSLPTDDDLAPRSDYDCVGGEGDGPYYVGTVRIGNGDDQYRLDADGDGIGCEGPNDEVIPLNAPNTATTTTAAPIPETSGAGEGADASGGVTYSGNVGDSGGSDAPQASDAAGGLPFTGPGLAPVAFLLGAILLVGGAAYYVISRSREDVDSPSHTPDAYPRLWKEPEDPVEQFWAKDFEYDDRDT